MRFIPHATLLGAMATASLVPNFHHGHRHPLSRGACNVNKSCTPSPIQNTVGPSGAGVCNYGQWRNGHHGPPPDKSKNRGACGGTPTVTPTATGTVTVQTPLATVTTTQGVPTPRSTVVEVVSPTSTPTVHRTPTPKPCKTPVAPKPGVTATPWPTIPVPTVNPTHGPAMAAQPVYGNPFATKHHHKHHHHKHHK